MRKSSTFRDYSEEREDKLLITILADRRGCPSRCFPFVLHEMLNLVERYDLQSIVSWQPHGRAFRIHNESSFMKYIMPFWFRQSKIASFQRQLRAYGFCPIKKGFDNGAFYHKYFLRGKKFLCHRIQKKKGVDKLQRSCHAAEPNFYQMKVLPVVDNEIVEESFAEACLPQPIDCSAVKLKTNNNKNQCTELDSLFSEEGDYREKLKSMKQQSSVTQSNTTHTPTKTKRIEWQNSSLISLAGNYLSDRPEEWQNSKNSEERRSEPYLSLLTSSKMANSINPAVISRSSPNSSPVLLSGVRNFKLKKFFYGEDSLVDNYQLL